MCGIFALFAPPDLAASLDPSPALAATRALRHRGPDGGGFAVFQGRGRPRVFADVDTPGAVLEARLDWGPDQIASETLPGPALAVFGHRRLAVVDRSPAGHQPLGDLAGRRWLTFNGEVYNWRALRRELEAQGAGFRTETDGEVVLAAWTTWGPACVDRFVGMWALVGVDLDARTAFVARDPFGIKPLYHARWRGALALASEVGALRALPGQRATLAAGPTLDYLLDGVTDHREETFLEGVRQVEPGAAITLDLDRPWAWRRRAGWAPAAPGPLRPATDPIVALRGALDESVRLHLAADVPVGAALSGGVDSSAIVALARRAAPEGPFHAFTFRPTGWGGAVDEGGWAALAATATGTTLHEVVVGPDDLRRDLDAILLALDFPFGGPSIIAQHYVFRAARAAGIPVLLDGQGADELFGGYGGYPAAALASKLQALGTRARGLVPGVGAATWARAIERLLPDPVRRAARAARARARARGRIDLTWFRARGAVPAAPARLARDPLREEQLSAILRASLPMLLRHEDRNAMAHSVESRVPFLTPALCDLALGLPPDLVASPAGVRKSGLRAALAGLVHPDLLARRDKVGFEAPGSAWLEALHDVVAASLGGEVARGLPFVCDAWRQTAASAVGRRRAPQASWRLFNLVRWLELVGARVE